MNKEFHALSLILTATVSMAVGAGLMYYKNKEQLGFMKKYPQYLEIQEYMKDSAVGLPDEADDEVVYNSFLTLYNDKYTDVFHNETAQEENVARVNNSPASFGTGFKIMYDEAKGYCFSEIEVSSPASAAGLEPDDIIVSVNGNDENNDEDFIRGLAVKDGTSLDLVVSRNGKNYSVRLTVSCDTQAAAGVSEEKYGNLIYLRLDNINNFTTGEVDKALGASDAKSLIIDLRQNSGGDTDSVVNLADLFVDKAQVVVKQKNGEEFKYPTNDGKSYELPIVVLTDEKTASAAEILTSFLKQYANAQIVGENTFGKGIIQNVATFNGYNLRYTVGTFTVGDWPCWQGVGIAPDIEVKMDPDLIGTDDDIQLQKALEILG